MEENTLLFACIFSLHCIDAIIPMQR